MELRLLRPGETPTLDDYNALVAAVQGLLRPASAGDFEFVPTAFGVAVNDYSRKPHDARITADRTDNFYGHVQIRIDPDDGTISDWPDDAERIEGTDQTAFAVELNGRTDVAEDTVVTLHPSPYGPFFTFVAPGGAGGTLKPTVISVECDEDGEQVVYVGARYGPARGLGGKVVDSSKVGVPGVTVTLRAAGGGATVATTTTNQFGHYCFDVTGTVSGANEVTAGGSYTPSAAAVSWTTETDVVADFQW